MSENFAKFREIRNLKFREIRNLKFRENFNGHTTCNKWSLVTLDHGRYIIYLGEERAGHVLQPQQFYLYLLLAEITKEPDFRHCSYIKLPLQ